MTNDEELMLLFAMRYAIGRRTYAPVLVCEQIMKKWKHIESKNLFIRDLEYEFKINERAEGYIGDKCDHMQWMVLLEFMKGNR